MTEALRHYCRNTHCRSKLRGPTDNPHRAFCCRGCHAIFHGPRCLVCGEKFRRKSGSQKVCIRKACKDNLRKFPDAYEWPKTSGTSDLPSNDKSIHLSPILRALIKPSGDISPPIWPDAAGNGWRWEAEELEHRLIDRDRKLAARIEASVGSRWRLTHPTTVPIMSAPDLKAGKRLAVSMALANLPLEDATAARVARNNAKGGTLRPRAISTESLKERFSTFDLPAWRNALEKAS